MNTICSNWFKHRYFKDRSIWNPGNTYYGSSIWRRIRRLAHIINEGSAWVFGNGKDINLWHDTWCGDKPLFVVFPNLHFPMDQQLASLFHSGSWHIPTTLPTAVKVLLASATSFLFPNPSARDRFFWKEAPDCQISQHGIWNTIRRRGFIHQWPPLIWNGISLPRVSCFGCRLMLNLNPH